jgi:hypothetical protein
MPKGWNRSTGALAIAIGVIGFASLASLGLFFAVGAPFGAINDWSIGVVGLLTALLVITVWRGASALGSTGPISTAAGVLGSLIVVLGSAFVISQTTGFFLAGLVESLGFALVGAWLVALNRSMASARVWPGGLTRLGIVAGVIMAIGVAVLPGIAMRLDDMATAPPWIWVGFVGWLGIFLLYPTWCLRLGRALRSRV